MILLSACADLPNYVIINDSTCAKRDVLRTPAEAVTFPLNEETRKVIQHLEEKYDLEENCAGLAAPQIGYNTRVIVFAVEPDEEIKSLRPDLSDTMPKSIWINPSYIPLSEDKTVDWEACFSVNDLAGRIPRFTEISYEAWTVNGKKIQGKAKGFLARLIQHEIDHLNGNLFIDYVPAEELVSQTQMRKERGQP